MLDIISKIFDANQKTLDRYQEVVDVINGLEEEYEKLSDEDLKAKTDEFKHRIKAEETLDDILPEAFAVVREAAKRTLDMRHYDVQLMAGMAFHEGKVAEQKTGEGKTLSATLALYLNGLTEKGAHLVTVNDYLAQRDAGWNAPLFHLLGLSTAVIYSGQGDQPASIYDPEYQGKERGDERLEHLRPVSRQEAYAADITYGTNNEFGFDYLRDNMAQSMDDMVQRAHNYAIVDEVDSILIDEARTPLIISMPDTEPTKKYYEFAKLVKGLAKDTDYVVDEKLRSVTLTDYGIRRLEKKLGIDNLYEKDYDTIHHVEQALKANTIFQKDKDYVVKDDQVIIVDEHTGRLMFGRRYSDGLHQAIEAKENVAIQQESRTLATVSLQNYFRMYNKLSGMTGTAETEAEEFQEIYGMDVVVVPTNKPVIRDDKSDLVYKTQRAKYGAIVKAVRKRFEKGQPVLIGTKSIEQNDIVSRYLKRMKVPHKVLNAKNHEQEAMIIADAGKPKAVTVATNIAGRGVDIVLGGAKPDKPSNPDTKELKSYQKAMKDWQNRHQEVLDLGGLHIIGSERHDSRRIDNQLRGRGGRQGDPGSSRFYVSLEDDLMRIFGGERVSKIMDALKIPEDQPIESGMVSKSIEQAQSKVEGFHFDQRKRVVEYDDVMNKQREIIYKRRNQILEEADDENDDDQLKRRVLDVINDEIQTIVVARAGEGYTEDEYDAILKEYLTIIPFDKKSQDKIKQKISNLEDSEAIIEELQEVANKVYDDREASMGPVNMRVVERHVHLSSIDRMWMNHLDEMDSLREGIWLRGGKDQVLADYKKEAFDMFGTLLSKINGEIARQIYRTQPARLVQSPISEQAVAGKQEDFNQPAPAPQPAQPSDSTGALAAALGKTSNLQGSSDGRNPVLVKVESNQDEPGRNDPCPCGAKNPKSGKPYKYKKCGLINAPHHQG